MARPTHEMDEQAKRLRRLAKLEELGLEHKVTLQQALAQQSLVKPQVTIEDLKKLIVSSERKHSDVAEKVMTIWWGLIKAKMESSSTPTPSSRQLATEALPKANPLTAEDLEARMAHLEKVASVCGVAYQTAVKNVTQEQLRSYVRSTDEKQRRAASLALDEWRKAIEAKQASVQQVQGATPKMTSPPSQQKPRLVQNSTSEILGLTQEERDYVLQRHNAWRGRCGSPELEYDANLAAHAQQWVNDLAGRLYWGPSPHNNNRTLAAFSGKVGENISRGRGTGASGETMDHLKSSVDGWALEFKDHDFTTHESKGTGHFTQVVWRDTTKVGCGYARIALPGEGWYWACVCNYHPAGNITFDGPDPYQFYKKNVSKPQAK